MANLNWLIQSFIGLFSATGMMILVLTQTKAGVSVNFIMMLIASVWFPSFAFLTYKEGIPFKITAVTLLVIIAAGILSVLANFMQFEAANKAPNAGIVYAIIGCTSVLVAVFSWSFLNGSLTAKQIVGIIFCTLGIVFLSTK
jgi:uncharacterized membrane protein